MCVNYDTGVKNAAHESCLLQSVAELKNESITFCVDYSTTFISGPAKKYTTK